MSLYIGNMSNQISREDLEHVFRKFGRCRIQMKDGFGFAVYEFRGNAERALRELRGRSICGEAVTLTWSNKQPKPYQTFGRANSFHDSGRGRNVYGGDPGRRGFSLSRRGRLNRFESVYGDRHHFTEHFDEKKVHRSGDIGSSGRDVSQHSVEDVAAGPDSITPADSERWDEASHMLPDLNGPAPADGEEFDRYYPYQSLEGNDVDESYQMNFEEVSESLGISQNGAGHGRRSTDTLTEPILQGKDSGNTNHDNYEGHKAKSVESHERTKPRSRESSCTARETSSTSELVSDRNGPVLKQKQNVLSNMSSPCPTGANNSQENDNGRKRRSERGNSREKIKQPKNMKRSLSSAFHGQSPDGLRSTRLHSSFSYSMASSLSDESENRTQKSRSRSRSFSSLSPLGSHDQPLASSPQNSFLNEDNCMGNATFPSLLEDPNEHVELLKGGRTTELRTAGCDVSTAGCDVSKSGISDAEKPYSIDLGQNRGPDGQDVGALALSPDTIKISSRRSLADSLDASQEASYEHLPPLDDNDALMKEDEAASADGVQASKVRSNSARHSGLLSEDIFMVLNHNGLEVTKENEKRQEPAEEFFGCARMWPWPIIYYRRLRKGPISVDNYAKRVLQNKEYGIIDKFVRSSSGWGEIKDLAD